MAHIKNYNILLSWLPAGKNYGKKTNEEYFKQAKTAMECLFRKNKIDSIDAIIFLASKYNNKSDDETDIYKLTHDEDILKHSVIEHHGLLKLKTLDMYKSKLEKSYNQAFSQNWDHYLSDDILSDQFDGIVKIIRPVPFDTMASITDEQVIFTNIKNILSDLLEIPNDCHMNIHVLISTGTPAMRTTWLLAKYNDLFKQAHNQNLQINYWNNQKRENNSIDLKKAFLIDDHSLFQGPSHKEMDNQDHDSTLRDIFENGGYNKRVKNFKKYLATYYLDKFDGDIKKTAKYLEVDEKTIKNNMK